MKFLGYQALEKIGSKAVCGFDVFDVSPKGTEAKEASNLLAFLKFQLVLPKLLVAMTIVLTKT